MGKTYTSNYNLTKDDENEFYNVAVQSENMDLIDGALKALSDEKVSHIEGKGLSTNDYSDAEKQKLAKIPEDATDYQHPATHSLDMITETGARKIFSSAERTKLSGIDEGANNYRHPDKHAPDIIKQDSKSRFVTDAEKNIWNNKANTSLVTTSVNGLMSKTDKVKLNGIEPGAQVNAVKSVMGKIGEVTVNKTDIGLGAVQNYGVASTQEAQAGKSNQKYMTPLRVKEMLDTGQTYKKIPSLIYELKNSGPDTSISSLIFNVFDNVLYYSWATNHSTKRYYDLGSYNMQTGEKKSTSSSTNSKYRNRIIFKWDDNYVGTISEAGIRKIHKETFSSSIVATPVAKFPLKNFKEEEEHIYYIGATSTRESSFVKFNKVTGAHAIYSMSGYEREFCIVGNYIVTCITNEKFYRVRDKNTLTKISTSETFSSTDHTFEMISISDRYAIEVTENMRFKKVEIDPNSGAILNVTSDSNSYNIDRIRGLKKLSDLYIYIEATSVDGLETIIFLLNTDTLRLTLIAKQSFEEHILSSHIRDGNNIVSYGESGFYIRDLL